MGRKGAVKIWERRGYGGLVWSGYRLCLNKKVFMILLTVNKC